VYGNTRYWDKLACWALSANGKTWTSFIADAKGPTRGVVTYAYETGVN
jgi:hypothetical protein